MSVRLIVDNTKLQELDVDPEEMDDLRAGFDEWLASKGELCEITERIENLRNWCDQQEEMMLNRIRNRGD